MVDESSASRIAAALERLAKAVEGFVQALSKAPAHEGLDPNTCEVCRINFGSGPVGYYCPRQHCPKRGVAA